MSDVVLVTGCTGQVGFELRRALAPLARVVAVDRQQCDLASPDSIRACIASVRPSFIVNAGAYTAVDKAESEPELAHAVNAVAPRVLAEEAARLNAALVHYSTDYVFNGEGERPYAETDATGPLGVYGASKLQGEQEIAAVGGEHWIFRTSWVFGLHGKNFLKTMLRLARERDVLSVVADQYGAPTSAALIADVTALLLRESRLGRGIVPGLYHLAAAGSTNWHGYAQRVISRAAVGGLALKVKAESIAAISSSAYPTPARRPHNSRLDCARLQEALGITLPDWTLAVDQATDILTEKQFL